MRQSLYSAEVFSVPEITKLQQHDAGRARIAAIARYQFCVLRG